MIFAAIFGGASVFFAALYIGSLLFQNQIMVGRRLGGLTAKSSDAFDEELEKPFSERFLRPMLQKLLTAVSPRKPEHESDASVRLARDLHLAGMTLEPQEFQMLQIITLFLCLGAFAIPAVAVHATMQSRLLIILFGLVLGILVPRYYLKARVKRRQNAIRQDLPDVMDLLSVSVEAGLGFDAALLHVCERTFGPLSEELMVVYREIRMGKARREAMQGLGERNNVEELKTFAGSMAQADQLGIPIRNVLASQSEQLRLRRRQRAEEKAMKAPVKMLIPMVLFILPVLFIILLGPAVLKVMSAFHMM